MVGLASYNRRIFGSENYLDLQATVYMVVKSSQVNHM